MDEAEFKRISEAAFRLIGTSPWILVVVTPEGTRTASNIADMAMQGTVLADVADSFGAGTYTGTPSPDVTVDLTDMSGEAAEGEAAAGDKVSE